MGKFLDLAYAVLKAVKQPMGVKAIWKYAEENGHLPDNLHGKTPYQTLKAKLSVDIRQYDKQSRFLRTAPGKFFLREMLAAERQAYAAPRLEPSGALERVLTFPLSSLMRMHRFQGISKNPTRYYDGLLRFPDCKYLLRSEAEENDDYKQIVTYTLVRRGNQLLAFTRGNFTRTERFLRGSQCIGFGGHVAESDLTFFNQKDLGVRDSAVRELVEEIDLPEQDKRRLRAGEGLRLIGALNDDSSAVGRRHFAFVFEYEILPGPDWSSPKKGEKAVIGLRWIDVTSESISVREFEYWSQLCLRVFFPKSMATRPSYLIRRRFNFKGPHLLCVLGPVASGKTEATSVFTKYYAYKEMGL